MVIYPPNADDKLLFVGLSNLKFVYSSAMMEKKDDFDRLADNSHRMDKAITFNSSFWIS